MHAAVGPGSYQLVTAISHWKQRLNDGIVLDGQFDWGARRNILI